MFDIRSVPFFKKNTFLQNRSINMTKIWVETSPEVASERVEHSPVSLLRKMNAILGSSCCFLLHFYKFLISKIIQWWTSLDFQYASSNTIITVIQVKLTPGHSIHSCESVPSDEYFKLVLLQPFQSSR